ncbi:MAG: hypothetical protein ACNI22_00025 [Halarcobacter sp.]
MKQLQKTSLANTKLLCLLQLTPELCLQLQDATKIIFVDATYSEQNPYALACSLEKSVNSNITHHISVFTIIEILKNLYGKNPDFEIFSILTKNFDSIINNAYYTNCINETSKQIILSIQKYN